MPVARLLVRHIQDFDSIATCFLFHHFPEVVIPDASTKGSDVGTVLAQDPGDEAHGVLSRSSGCVVDFEGVDQILVQTVMLRTGQNSLILRYLVSGRETDTTH